MTAETVSLGIPTLDRALMDGVPAGYTILVSGVSGSGVELFAKQVASAGDHPTVYFTTDETGEEVLDAMSRFGWTEDLQVEDISSRYYQRISNGKLAYDRRRQGGATIDDLLEGGTEQSTENFLTTTAATITDEDRPRRVVVHDLRFFFDEYDDEEVLSVLRAIRTYNRHVGGLVLLALSGDAVKQQLRRRIEANVDMVVELEMDRMSSSFEHRMVVKKVMNHPEKAQMFVYGITDDGITPEMVTRVT